MFREMRRARQQLSQSETEEILEQGKSGVLSVLGDDGYPYAVPINYVYVDGKVYFHGAKAGHKLDAIRRCGKVSLCVIRQEDIVPEELTTYFKSVILFGRARVLETEEETVRATRALGLKYNSDEEAVEKEIRGTPLQTLCCVEITVEHMTGKEAIELTRARSAQPKGV